MSDTVFKPRLYLLHGCPFCMKLRLFLLETGLLDQVDIQLVESGSEELRHAREKLAPHLAKVSFPAIELTPGHYIADSDDIIAWFANGAGIDIETLPTFQDFVSGIFDRYLGMYRENMQLKQHAT